MNGIHAVGASNQPSINPNSHRVGSPSHPGRHLGQIKHSPSDTETQATLPLVQQQLSGVNAKDSDVSSSASNRNTKSAASSPADLSTQLILSNMQSANNNINDSISFSLPE